MSNLFPDGFQWGAATSSYQIEGGVCEEGRSESVWDRFARTPGATRNGESGAVACDHYHRFASDIELMRDIGLTAYRFSVAWPRVIPDGRGPINHAGLDFYDRLVDGLLEAGITPFLTLYHWDHPQILEDGGGWRSREIVQAFADYAVAVVDRLGDRVHHWLTHNEPWVVAHLGHRTGQHAPGLIGSGAELDVAHHLLLSHGVATQAMRAARSDISIGIALNLEPRVPRSQHPLDVAAAQLEQGLMNEWFLDPLVGRGYPSDLLADAEWAAEVVFEGDMEMIAEPIDLIGLNYYRIETVGDPGVSVRQRPRPLHEDPTDTSTMGWPVTPEGLSDMLHLLDSYGFASIYITENGGAFPDDVVHDGVVHDLDRISYFERHLAVAGEAIAKGVPLHGFFAWSLMDNFEWSFGYARRFGIVHVDFDTQVRTPKKSAEWYRDVITRNGIK